MLIETQRDLAALLAARAQGTTVQGIMVLMENADPIIVPEDAAEWFARGVRLVGPAWRATRYCGGTGQPGPLTPLGFRLMAEMQRAGLALDISHMAEESFWQAIQAYDGPVVATHSNCRALVSNFRSDRHLSDDMIKALIERDAVIGAVLYNKFLYDGWQVSMGKQVVDLNVVVDHIDHVCQIAGSARYSGIGSDLDGGFGSEAIPSEIDSIADLGRIGEALGKRGYTQADIEGILGGNWLRKLGSILPA